MRIRTVCLVVAWWLAAATCGAGQASPLWQRGYSVIPTPRDVKLATGDVELSASWSLTGPDDIAARTLRKDFQEFHGIVLRNGSSGKVIRLGIAVGTVKTAAEAGIDRQAYRLRISPSVIEITGNAAAGLFYGVQTLVQLTRRDGAGRVLVPEGVIEDWPSYELRFLHWDAQQHQDRVETLKRYLDWSARVKANMIAFQLEDKFEFPSHPVVGTPGAYTTAQLQDLVNYGLERHIQIVPLIQAPAHFSWALKHADFVSLRADGNNYQANTCDPKANEFIFQLYDDVIDASKGVNYLFASTDEVYYAGIDPRCAKPYTPENRSLEWINFVRQANEHLAKRGRKMLIWAEYPLLPEHAKLLPAGIIDGVVGNPGYAAAEETLGIRHLRYVSMQGEELIFPGHLGGGAEPGLTAGRLRQAYESISQGRQWDWRGEWKGSPIGVFGAAWDCSGLHNETYWLGWSAVAQYSWNRSGAPVEQYVPEFLQLYYGHGADGMLEVYRLMETQAREWQRSWDAVPSRVRGLSYGNSRGKGIGTQRRDMTLEAPPLPALPDIVFQPSFSSKYESLIAAAPARQLDNDRLILALHSNIGRVERNRYNLEVYLSLATLMGHHWRLFVGLADAERALSQAYVAAQKKNARRAVGLLVAAHNSVEKINADRKRIYREMKTVFEKSMYERGRSVGGRKFVNFNDDTKDYWAQRRPDLTYMTSLEESTGLEKWQEGLRYVIESYAKANNVPVRGLAEARLEE